MGGLTSSQVCDQEYRSAVRALRPSLDRESAGRTVAAPTVVNQGRGTRNHLQWLQISLHLEDRVVNP